jgi:hypothetical protein
MDAEQYALRLKSPAWKDFTRRLRQRAGDLCQMCGDRAAELHCHHMRYHWLGTENEWRDIIVLCSGCHTTYHQVHKKPPAGERPRAALCNELVTVLMRKGRNVGFYLNHDDTLCRHWLASPIVMAGARSLDFKTPAKPSIRTAKIKKQKREKPHFDPMTFAFDEAHVRKLFANPSISINGRVWRQRLGVPTPYPKKWKRRLMAALEKRFPHLKPSAPLVLACMNDDLDAIHFA